MHSKDLISRYCRGKTKEFPSACQQFLPPEMCRFMRDDALRVIFEQGRCRPKTILRATVKGRLKRFQDLFSPDAPEDYVDSLTFELVKQLKEQQLTNRPTLPALKSYFNAAVAHAVTALLEKLDLLPPKTCGYCIHLSRSKPTVCQRFEIEEQEGKIIRENPWYQKKRIPSERACKEGFEPYTFEPLPPNPPEPSSEFDKITASIEVDHLLALLSERADQADGQKKIQKYERQFSIFSYLVKLFRLGYSLSEACEEICGLLDINQKMLRRDLHEITAFFLEKNVLEASNFPPL